MGRAILAAVCGAGLAGGAWLAAAGLPRTSRPPAQPPTQSTLVRRLRSLADRDQALRQGFGPAQLAGAAAAGGLGWAATGWPVAALIGALAVLGLPALANPGRGAQQAIARLEGCEEWTRGLANRLLAGMSLEQAIIASQHTAPAVIEPEVSQLAARLRNSWPTPAALAAFADELGEATGDLVAAGLRLSARRRGAGLSQVLEELANSVADEVGMRRRIEADRARPRTTARLVSLIAVATFAGLALSGDYMAPYHTPLGQLVLAAITGTFAAALVWMHTLAQPQPEPRFVGTAAPTHPGAPTRGGTRPHGPRQASTEPGRP